MVHVLINIDEPSCPQTVLVRRSAVILRQATLLEARLCMACAPLSQFVSPVVPLQILRVVRAGGGSNNVRATFRHDAHARSTSPARRGVTRQRLRVN